MIENLKKRFPVFSKNSNLVFFDTAASALKVDSMINAVNDCYSYEYANIKPDIVPIAKGIGGGFPIGAVLMTKKVSKAMVPGTHGSTFGGNPLAMSVGNAVMDKIFKKGFLSKVKSNSKYFN